MLSGEADGGQTGIGGEGKNVGSEGASATPTAYTNWQVSRGLTCSGQIVGRGGASLLGRYCWCLVLPVGPDRLDWK